MKKLIFMGFLLSLSVLVSACKSERGDLTAWMPNSPDYATFHGTLCYSALHLALIEKKQQGVTPYFFTTWHHVEQALQSQIAGKNTDYNAASMTEIVRHWDQARQITQTELKTENIVLNQFYNACAYESFSAAIKKSGLEEYLSSKLYFNPAENFDESAVDILSAETIFTHAQQNWSDLIKHCQDEDVTCENLINQVTQYLVNGKVISPDYNFNFNDFIEMAEEHKTWLNKALNSN